MSKPVEKFTVDGVNVAIWENQGPKGAFRTATIQLRYKDGNEWKESRSYGPKDLEKIEKAVHEARERILKANKAKPGSPEAA